MAPWPLHHHVHRIWFVGFFFLEKGCFCQLQSFWWFFRLHPLLIFPRIFVELACFQGSLEILCLFQLLNLWLKIVLILSCEDLIHWANFQGQWTLFFRFAYLWWSSWALKFHVLVSLSPLLLTLSNSSFFHLLGYWLGWLNFKGVDSSVVLIQNDDWALARGFLEVKRALWIVPLLFKYTLSAILILLSPLLICVQFHD